MKPQRAKVKRDVYRNRWWRFAEPQNALYEAIGSKEYVLATGAAAAMHHMIASVPARAIFSHKLCIFIFDTFAPFAVMQGGVHEIWSRSFGTTFGSVDALTYNPTQVFRTFPFPLGFMASPSLEATGKAYHTFRAELMIKRNEGLTKIYNRFHARGENAPDVARLRALHAEMDAAVLRAYGWDDLAERARPAFIDQEADEGKTPKTRLDWPAEFKDEILARLLAVNAERAAAERAAGLTAILEDEDDDIDEAAVT